jgi:hypothetical protein
MNSLKNQKIHRYRPGNIKITSDLTNLRTNYKFDFDSPDVF